MARPSWIGVVALAAVALLGGLALGGCGSERVLVMVPPELDLGAYEAVGVVEFSGSDPPLQAEAGRQFRDEALQAQPGVRLIELDGAEAASLSKGRLAPEALAQLRDEFGVDAIFVGDLQISEVKPRVSLSSSLIQMRATAEAHGTLNVRLVETAGGATVWSRSGRDTVQVATMGANSRGGGHIGIADADSEYAGMVAGLTSHVAAPLWPRYIRRKPEDVPPHYVVTYPDGVAVYAPPRQVVAETR